LRVTKSEVEIPAAPEPSLASRATERPKLVFFYGRTSGPSRRLEAYLSQVLQRRQNHNTFRLIRVCADTNPELVQRFAVTKIPSLVVVEGRRIRARIEAPTGRVEIVEALSPWLK
jgi:thioredoxin-like negative regulator of GroEL